MAGERSLQETPTWTVALVCFVLVAISIVIEHVIHLLGSWLRNRHKRALYEALEKIKAELMLLGFISLLLTITQDYIAQICIPKKIGESWHPCQKDEEPETTYEDKCSREGEALKKKLGRMNLPSELTFKPKRTRGSAGCAGQRSSPRVLLDLKGKVQFVSAYGLHQLHIFIFVLAVSHVLYCITTLALGRLKMRKWKAWEIETRTAQYQYYNDPERFRFARETSFGRRHLSFWSKSPILLWSMCFFRQFITSVAKVDYLTLRHGFIIAHLAPQSQMKFDFQKYISRSLDEDFKVVAGISPIIWFLAVLFLLTNTYGWYSYLWLPFIPLIILLMVGTKLQVIITKMGLRIQERGVVIKGAPVVQPGDDLFWFKRPRLILFLIHFVLFTNAFQFAFFVWSWYEFGLRSCFHKRLEDIIIRLSMGVIIQVLCSYVTFPLYALVTQMGSTMKPTIFSDQVATALRAWHQTAKRHTKHGHHSETQTPFSSRPATPMHGATSPMHLLHSYPNNSTFDSPPQTPPNERNWDPEYSPSPQKHDIENYTRNEPIDHQEQGTDQEQRSTQVASAPNARHSQHEINISLADFSFEKRLQK